MDLHEIVKAVAAYIQESNGTNAVYESTAIPGCRKSRRLSSLHTENVDRLHDPFRREWRATRPMEYRQACAQILEEWSKLSVQPILFGQWQQGGGSLLRGGGGRSHNADGGDVAGDGAARRRHRLHWDLYAITERYAPGVMAAPASNGHTGMSMPASSGGGASPVTPTVLGTCSNCGSDVPLVAFGVCDICSTVLSETNGAPPAHAQTFPVDGFGRAAAVPPPAIRLKSPAMTAASAVVVAASASPATVVIPLSSEVEREHSNLRTGVPAAAGGGIYQRRVQFKLASVAVADGDGNDTAAMAMYQGKSMHPIPAAVIDDVRDQLETTARHLINVAASDKVERYANVTRVHVLSLLRGPGGSARFAKWYRDAHAIHTALTGQAPPDISAHESILLLLFVVGGSLSVWMVVVYARSGFVFLFFIFVFKRICKGKPQISSTPKKKHSRKKI